MSALVEVRDICKVYNPGENEVRALDHVSLTIDEGEFVAIIGQSGSGKSTLMNMLGCLDTPTSGKYLLHGIDVSHMTDDEQSDVRNREIGFIFQGFNLIQSLTALENVELPLMYRGVSKKKRRELSIAALEHVGLGKRMTHKPTELSGGQQQRVAIARAIAQAPPILLADEPTGNLDSGSSREIIATIKNLHAEGRTVILITHDPGIAKQAKRIITISDGRIANDEINPDFTSDVPVKIEKAIEASASSEENEASETNTAVKENTSNEENKDTEVNTASEAETEEKAVEANTGIDANTEGKAEEKAEE
nr:ABC transporter ATP-binding protein [Butyrivibrio sp. VCD2006]